MRKNIRELIPTNHYYLGYLWINFQIIDWTLNINTQAISLQNHFLLLIYYFPSILFSINENFSEN